MFLVAYHNNILSFLRSQFKRLTFLLGNVDSMNTNQQFNGQTKAIKELSNYRICYKLNKIMYLTSTFSTELKWKKKITCDPAVQMLPLKSVRENCALKIKFLIN